ncbi:hypothetical protein E1A91_A12G276300v1 [Gossypium mustelinum]|uniref:Membrane-associated kinase regulator 5 n=1 Tax=Gossypium mustelinum TaxID=34275 RepID=A0A5D2WZ19_GOSMU|nr:hypothetical protein E1A91_A12G276300v1 [Gossypium mustelinum]
MEALNFLMFWKPSNGVHKVNQTQPCDGNGAAATVTVTATAASGVVSDHELDEGEDSFIDLEFPLRDFNGNGGGRRELPNNVVGNKELSLSPADHFSKRKIMPIDPISKPQSPIALLKSAQRFRVFTPKKSKSMANTGNTTRLPEKTKLVGVSMETPKHENHNSREHFTRENSFRRTKGKIEDDPSKRLSKDLVHKYLNVIKPLYTKISKKHSQTHKFEVSGDLSTLSPATSPATVYSVKEKQGNTNIKAGYKHLGKSRSASAAASPISRRDDSLLLQHDGIQSAILHCKRSFNSSRESSWLSRCTSDCSSQEKLSNASSTESSLFSRVASISSYEKLMDSARTSSEEGNGFTT